MRLRFIPLLACSALAIASNLHAEELQRDAVIATRGDVSLTIADVDAKVRSMPEEIRKGYLLDPDRMARLIDSTLLTLQLAREAERAGLQESADFADDLALQRAELLSRRAIDKFMSEVPAPAVEALARERYLVDPEPYRPSPSLEIRHMLFYTDGRDEERAKQGAEEFLAEVKAGGEFLKVVEKFIERFGDDATSEQLINPDTGRLDTRFAASLSQLRKTGDVVGPIRSRYGWHVVLLEKYETFDLPAFDEVKDRIVNQLRGEQLAAERARYVASFSKIDTEINGDAIRILPLRYAPDLQNASPPTSPLASPPVKVE